MLLMVLCGHGCLDNHCELDVWVKYAPPSCHWKVQLFLICDHINISEFWDSLPFISLVRFSFKLNDHRFTISSVLYPGGVGGCCPLILA